MKNIEIATAHNIIFKYELASVLMRLLAFAIDLFILIVYSIVASIVFGSNTVTFYIFVLLAVGFYHLICEVFNRGQSVGKRALKLRVITLRGNTPTLSDYFVRWIFRIVDITLSAGTLAILSIIGSDKNQRIGDLIAQTSVISLKNSQHISLKGLKELDKNIDEIKYPGLRRYTDEDMLLLKHTIERFVANKSDNNRAVLNKIGRQIYDDLEIKNRNVSVDKLRTLLKEYVILTR